MRFLPDEGGLQVGGLMVAYLWLLFVDKFIEFQSYLHLLTVLSSMPTS